MIYLDHCATTKLSENVKNDILNNLDNFGNPSSIYSIGFKAKEIIENSRKKIAECINCRPSEIYFTSGASEANSWALQSPFFCLPYEHHSILNNHNSIVNNYKYYHYYHQQFFSTNMLVNNEVGFINNLKEFRKKYPTHYFHTDATQAIGNIDVDIQKLNVDTLSFSGHKFHAPKGIGVLYINSKSILYPEPIIYGGKQENGLRGGTENILGISAMGVAIEDAFNNISRKQKHCKMLKERLINNLNNAKLDYIINTPENSIDSILSISFRGIDSQVILTYLDTQGICISNGSACNSGTTEISETLQWLKVPQEYVYGTLRVSFDLENTIEEIDVFSDKLIDFVKNHFKG